MTRPTIGIIGGIGPQGSELPHQFTRAGDAR
jgi:hypothetical protein